MMINGSKMLNRVVQMMDKVQSNLTTSYLLFRNNSALFSTCNQFKTDDVFQPELACTPPTHSTIIAAAHQFQSQMMKMIEFFVFFPSPRF